MDITGTIFAYKHLLLLKQRNSIFFKKIVIEQKTFLSF
ncbi:hypothetical protein Thert_02379 [Thermoanaerobacterium thermosaccharolyticum]|uniref:Uncharacterized protein n=1 Tax=Thermoanaerobacterium thermosaccharolyticum TaxID=1517 RepID=A0A223I0N8_THETR|nr:hypothetical protein Thert_02379 [Thermoanaerobacterium thermosaccharolyticum]